MKKTGRPRGSNYPRKITFVLENDLFFSIEEYCYEKQINRSELIREALRNRLESFAPKKQNKLRETLTASPL